MAGVLLRSGSVKHYLPLGATGNPVYSAASQIRAAMRRQLGTALADYFALPKQDEKGETIDWYSPFEGSVVPWTAATPEERSDAKAKLLAAQGKLLEKSDALQASDDSEQQVFGKLLALATRIPGEDHVYLVDGRPVLTFWGFSERDAPPDQDVLAGLDIGGRSFVGAESAVPGGADEADSAAAAAETRARSRWRFWLWLLLPLLLFLLWFLLFGLKSCVPEWPPRLDLIWPERKDEPVLDDKELPEHSERTLDRDQETDEDRTSTERREIDRRTRVDGAVRDSDTRTGEFDRRYEGARSVDETGEEDRTTSEDTDAVDRSDRTGAEETGETTGEDEAAKEEDADRGAEGKDEKIPPDEGKPGDEDRAEEKKGEDADKKASDDDKAGEEEKTSSRDSGRGKARDSGQPLRIPPDALKKGSTDFLNGNWRSVSGLQDADGNPVQLEYQFKNGEGTAKLRRSIGGKDQECTAAVRPSFKGSRLVIDQADDIRCPDGSRFQRSTVECATNPKGQAECTGKYPGGKDYDVSMSKK